MGAYIKDFWIPQYKYQYVEWLQKNYPKNKIGITINWNNRKLEQLRAIYIKLRREEQLNVQPPRSYPTVSGNPFRSGYQHEFGFCGENNLGRS